MRLSIYLHMIYLINMCRTWVVVDNGFTYRQNVVFRHGRVIPYASRALRLRSILPKDGYVCGTMWSISEHDLDRGLAVYRKDNPEARARLKKNSAYLNAKDVEAIIGIASYGLVKLELTDLPSFK